MAAYEFRSELVESIEDFTWHDMEATHYVKFAEAVKKMGFKPTRRVIYHCMYRSDIPTYKFVLHRPTKKGFDKVVFYSCIHNCEFAMRLDGETFKSGPMVGPFHTMEMYFRDFVLEKEPWLLESGSASVFKRYPNEAQMLYNPYQTRNPNLLAPQFRRSHPKKQKLMTLLLLIYAIRRKTVPVLTK